MNVRKKLTSHETLQNLCDCTFLFYFFPYYNHGCPRHFPIFLFPIEWGLYRFGLTSNLDNLLSSAKCALSKYHFILKINKIDICKFSYLLLHFFFQKLSKNLFSDIRVSRVCTWSSDRVIGRVDLRREFSNWFAARRPSATNSGDEQYRWGPDPKSTWRLGIFLFCAFSQQI